MVLWQSSLEGVEGMIDFFKDKRVFITGHTGFKGTWLSHVLLRLGATIKGYALAPSTEPNLFNLTRLNEKMASIIGDINDFDRLKHEFDVFKPDIAIHLAAQPLVRESYIHPLETYQTNVMGTVHFLECVRLSSTVKSVLNVTTDKVYLNKEWEYGYREIDQLNGYDPYSNSKSCSELVTDSYRRSFFAHQHVAISTARAGNVIGGGDYSTDRIIPDCVRAAQKNEAIIVRNPHSIRPYQHVLEPLIAYLLIVMKQYNNPKLASNYNVGPDDQDCVTTEKLVNLFCQEWGDVAWINRHDGGPHEASFLKLDCSKMKSTFSWNPLWNIEETIKRSVILYQALDRHEKIEQVMHDQIDEYLLHAQAFFKE